MELFPKQVQDFANLLVTMQAKRHKVDYDPTEKAYKSSVLLDVENVKTTIEGFERVALKDRRSFAAWVLFKPPRS